MRFAFTRPTYLVIFVYC